MPRAQTYIKVVATVVSTSLCLYLMLCLVYGSGSPNGRPLSKRQNEDRNVLRRAESTNFSTNGGLTTFLQGISSGGSAQTSLSPLASLSEVFSTPSTSGFFASSAFNDFTSELSTFEPSTSSDFVFSTPSLSDLATSSSESPTSESFGRSSQAPLTTSSSSSTSESPSSSTSSSSESETSDASSLGPSAAGGSTITQTSTRSSGTASRSALLTTFSSVDNGRTIIVTQTSMVTSAPSSSTNKNTSSGGLSQTNKIVVGVVVGVGGAIIFSILGLLFWFKRRSNKDYDNSGWTFWRKNEKGGNDDYLSGELGVRDRNINQGSNF